MSLIAFLTSSVGGALLGALGQGVTQLIENYRANQESKRKIAEMEALAKIKVEETSWAAFQESLKARSSSFTMPANATPWQNWVFVIVEAIVRLVNPALTLAAVLILWNFYHTLSAELKGQFFPEVAAFSFAVCYWWIGQRYQGKLQPGK